MLNFAFLLEAETASTGGFPWSTIIIFGVLIIFFIFMSSRNKKQQKEEANMRDSLAVGDEVTTIGGIIGKVVSVKGETFVLETTKDKTKIRFLKGAIRSVDVKAADIAAAVMEAKAEEEAATTEEVTEAPAEDTATEETK
ncbi:MAG: preprotein translocase subunit YajC [Clostridia bacterium]|nr:preprotein translocase subunit YajC [Clostridia bacterium]